jgi:hypothetical protein
MGPEFRGVGLVQCGGHVTGSNLLGQSSCSIEVSMPSAEWRTALPDVGYWALDLH